MRRRDMRNFADCESGATALEYALIAAMISLASFAALNLLGTELGNPFDGVALSIATAVSGT